MGAFSKKAHKQQRALRCAETEQKIRDDAHGFMTCVFMAYLHIFKKYEKEELLYTFQEFLSFFSDMAFEGTVAGDYIDMIKEDCGVDLEAEFKKIKPKLAIEAAQRKCAIKGGRRSAEDSG